WGHRRAADPPGTRVDWRNAGTSGVKWSTSRASGNYRRRAAFTLTMNEPPSPEERLPDVPDVNATAGALAGTYDRPAGHERGVHPRITSGCLKAVQPRSQLSTAPVRLREASLARKTTSSAISSGVCRPVAWPLAKPSRKASLPKISAFIGVST